MEITIERLLDGKPTVIKDKEYLETGAYIAPFISFMKKFTNEFYAWAQTPSQFTLTDNKRDITYNRVWIQAVMPKDIDGFAETFNLVYGLDVRQPVYKIFKAYKNRKNNNLFVFDSRWLSVYELKPSEKFNNFEQQILNLMQMVDDSSIRIKKMKSENLVKSSETKQESLGNLIERSMLYEYKTKAGKTKLSPIVVLKAYENVYLNSSSKYYVSSNEECSLFNMYNAFSSLVQQDDKDILSQWEKLALCSQILNEEILWK